MSTKQNSIDNKAYSFSSDTTVIAGTGLTVTTGDATISAGNINIPTTSSTVGQLTINSVPFLHNYGSTTNVFLGDSSGNFTMSGANYNVGVGKSTLPALTSGDGNVCVGREAGNAITTGSSNICIGNNAGLLISTGSNNIAIGTVALDATTTTGSSIAIGSYALTALNDTGATNIAIGTRALEDATTGTDNVAIGYYAGRNVITTSGITAIGAYAFDTATDPVNGTAIGFEAGKAVTDGKDLTLVGYQAGKAITTGDYHTAVGSGALASMATSTSGCVAIGYLAGNAMTSGANVAIGTSSLRYGTSITYSTAVGYQAAQGDSSTAPTGDYNTAVGNAALKAYTSGAYNTAVGSTCLTALTEGTYNTGLGNGALAALTSGTYNTALGAACLKGITDGTKNIGIGTITSSTGGGSALTGSDSNNIMIGNVGVSGDADTIRIGTDQTKFYAAGIYDVAIGTQAVYVASTGQLGKTSSSLKYKENIKDIGSDSDALYKLRPVSFTWISNPSAGKHYGLIAEEVAQVMPELAGYDKETGEPNSVYYERLPALLLNELQKRNKIILELGHRIESLEAQLMGKDFCGQAK
jgi:trimeric autotransporter adhesin